MLVTQGMLEKGLTAEALAEKKNAAIEARDRGTLFAISPDTVIILIDEIERLRRDVAALVAGNILLMRGNEENA